MANRKDTPNEPAGPAKGQFVAPPFFSGQQYNVIFCDANELQDVLLPKLVLGRIGADTCRCQKEVNM